MIKKINYLLVLSLLFTASYSCNKDSDSSQVKKYLIKTIQIDRPAYEYIKYEITYDSSSKNIKQVTECYLADNFRDSMNYDYSKPAKLTLKYNNEYLWRKFDINGMGYVAKDDKSNDFFELWFDYSYDANGYLVKMKDNSDSIVMESFVVDGNKIKQINYEYQSGAEITNQVVRIAEYSFTDIDNVNDIDQFYFRNPDYRVYAGLFGETNKKLVDHIEYWDPRFGNTTKSNIKFSYTFDGKNRVSKVVRSGSNNDTYTYTYFE